VELVDLSYQTEQTTRYLNLLWFGVAELPPLPENDFFEFIIVRQLNSPEVSGALALVSVSSDPLSGYRRNPSKCKTSVHEPRGLCLMREACEVVVDT
jgi:hypothetical protein